MFFLTRGLPVLIELGLLIYCLIDCIQTPAESARNLPKWAWIVLIVVAPLIGSIAWLVAGRPARRGDAPWPAPRTPGFGENERPTRARTVAPDDDPDFLAGLDSARDDQRLLESWEEDLRRREGKLKPKPDGEPPPDDPEKPA